MQGKILADGLISGNDGNRYHFKGGDIKNMPQNSSVEALINSEVDFEGADGNASDIYIIKQSVSLESAKQKLLSTDISNVKIKAYIAIGADILGALPVVGLLFSVIGFVMGFIVSGNVGALSQSKTLVKNYVMMYIVAIVGIIIVLISVFAGIGGTYMSISNFDMLDFDFGTLRMMGVGTIIGVVIGILVAVVGSAIFSYSYSKELSFVTNEKFFLYAFWCMIAGVLTAPIIIGIFILLIGFVLCIAAWARTTEIRQSYNAKV